MEAFWEYKKSQKTLKQPKSTEEQRKVLLDAKNNLFLIGKQCARIPG